MTNKKSPTNAKDPEHATVVHVWKPSKTKSVARGRQTTGS